MMNAKWVKEFRHSREGGNPVLSLDQTKNWIPAFAGMTVLIIALASTVASAHEEQPILRNYTATPTAPAFQTWDDAGKKSAGCVSCHTKSDRKTMHANDAVVLGCTDCHGGDANIFTPPGETYSADDHHD